MDIITQAETDNIDHAYVPFVYQDTFPGMGIRFPKGVKIVKVLNKNLQFLPSIQTQYYNADQLNILIDQIFTQTQKTKAFQNMSFKIAKPPSTDNQEVPGIELALYTTPKPFIPRLGEMISWRGAYLHFQINNLFKSGEKFSSGILLNQRNFSYITKFRIPLNDASFKIRIAQAKNLHSDNLPTKFVDLRLHETVHDSENQKNYIDYSVRWHERSNISKLESGFRVQLLHDARQQDFTSVWLKQRKRLSLSLNLWPDSNQSDISLKYNNQFEMNLQKIWPQSIKKYMFIVWRNNFQIERSSGSTLRPGYLQGFGYLDALNKYYITNYSRFYFQPIPSLRQSRVFPFVSASVAYQSGINKTDASIGIGLQVPFVRKYRLYLQYNLIHMHNNKDKVLTAEIYLD